MLAGYPPFFDDGRSRARACVRALCSRGAVAGADPFGIYEKILSMSPLVYPPFFHKDAKARRAAPHTMSASRTALSGALLHRI